MGHPARKAAVDAFTSEADPAKRAALWANVQKTIYDEVPFIKIGDFNALSAKSTKLDGVVPAPWPYFWNVTLRNDPLATRPPDRGRVAGNETVRSCSATSFNASPA